MHISLTIVRTGTLNLTSLADWLRSWMGRLGLDAEAPWPYLAASLLIRLPRHANALSALAPFFPHINLYQLRPADVVRLPLQVAWIVLVRPSPQVVTRGWFRQRVTHWAHWCLTNADRSWRSGTRITANENTASAIDHFITNSLDRASRLRRTLLLALASGCVLVAAGLPLTQTAQGLLSVVWLSAMALAHRSGHILRHTAYGLALLLSARYFWWRITETLPSGSQFDLTLALLLVLAEIRLRFGLMKTGNAWLSALRRASLLWAQATLLLAPPLVLLTGTELVRTEAGDMMLYALPHLLTWWCAGSRNVTLLAVRMGRSLAFALDLLKVGARTTANTILFWANAVAGTFGVTIAIFVANAWLIAIFTGWALLNSILLGLATMLCTRPVSADSSLAPSMATQLAVAGLKQLFHTSPAFPERWQTTPCRLKNIIGNWLPRSPAACTSGIILAMITVFAVPSEALAQTPEQNRRLSVKMLTNQNSLPLRSADGSTSVYFGQRADELVTSARLHLRYTHSPALLPKDSHITITLNDEVIGVAPIHKDADGKPLHEEFVIDPRFIADRNELRFRFVGHYAQTCEDPLRNSLWAEISGASEIVIGYASLVLQEDLSRLPEPFFDKRDLTGLTLPIVFSSSPGLPTLHAAGIIASWFGNLAGERGARFPVQADRPAPGHGIVIATNAERPAFLRGRPQVDGPTLEMITNPTDGVSKLLLVLGRDGIDVAEAARALALGHAAMSGQKVSIRSRREVAPRQAYDAPNWARNDRPTRLGELIAYPQQLQAKGHTPPPLKLDLRIAPDLFTIGRRDVPMTLRYRYSPPMRSGDNLLTLSLNDQLVSSWSLDPADGGRTGVLSRLARNNPALISDHQRLSLPLHRLRGHNRMSFDFAFSRHQEGPCPDIPPDDSRRALVDPESTIDFSRYYHFSRMPNLNHFATAGFPFTKFADLSQTIMVMPEKPGREEIEAAMNLLGHFGRVTGLPASQIRIVGPGDEAPLSDADLLVIGSAMGQGALAKWPDYVPADISGDIRRISQPARTMNFLYDWLGFAADPDEAILSQDKFSAEGPLALIVGFRSPLSTTRSVVAITASAPDQLWQATNAISDEKLSRSINGSVAFIRGAQVHSLRVGESYFVGELPWWVMIWFPLSVYPLLVAFLTIAAVVLLTTAWLRLRTQQGRVSNGEEDDN